MKNSDYIHDLLESPLFNEWASSGFDNSHSFTSTSLYLNSSSDTIELAKTIKSSLTFNSSKSLGLKKRSALLTNIHNNIEASKLPAKIKSNKSFPVWKYGSFAAAFVLLIAFTFTFNANKDSIYSTGLNESLTQQLVDGSTVILDANSSIRTIGKWKGINPRKVKLENSAFFKVTKGTLFSVETDLATIDVLGTEFYVDSDEEEVTVTVKSGKVKVSPVGESDSEVQILEAGDKVVYTKATGIVKSKVNNSELNDELAWIEGKIVFNNTNFQELKQILEERYNKTVTIHPSLLSSTRAIKGTFPTKSLTTLLTSIEMSLDLQINYTGNTVNITYRENK